MTQCGEMDESPWKGIRNRRWVLEFTECGGTIIDYLSPTRSAPKLSSHASTKVNVVSCSSIRQPAKTNFFPHWPKRMAGKVFGIEVQ